MIGTSSVGRGRVVSGANVGTSSLPCVFPTSLNLALDPGSFGHLGPNESRFVLNVVNV